MQCISLYWQSGTFTLSHIISLNPPARSLSITGHWNMSLPSGASPWNSISLSRVEGQNITIVPKLFLLILLLLITVISPFLYILRIPDLLYLHNPQYCWAIFFFFFRYTVCQCYSPSIRPYTSSSSISLFFDPSLCIFLLSLLRRVQSILKERVPRHLFLWLYFSWRVWFRDVFLYFWCIPFLLFLSFRLLDGTWGVERFVILRKEGRKDRNTFSISSVFNAFHAATFIARKCLPWL